MKEEQTKVKRIIDYRHQYGNYYQFIEEELGKNVYIHKEHSVWRNLKVKRRKKYIFATLSIGEFYNLGDEVELEEINEKEAEIFLAPDFQTSSTQPYKLEDFEKWLETSETNRAGMEAWWEYFLNWYEERPSAWNRTIEKGWVPGSSIEKHLEEWELTHGESGKQEVKVLYRTIFIWKLEVDSAINKIEKKPETKKVITLQQHLDSKYTTPQTKKEVKVIDVGIINQLRRSQRINELLEGNELDLSGYSGLEIVRINGSSDLETKITKLTLANQPNLKEFKCYNNQLAILDIGQCPKLTDLCIDTELFTESKITGLEKISLVRLDFRGENLLQKSEIPEFIWETFRRKYQTVFPEMKLVKTEDLDCLANQLNKETAKDETFLKQFCNEKIIKSKKGKFYWILDCLANQLLARCLVVQNRLGQGKNEEYEKHLMEKAQKAECQLMNPQNTQNFLYKDRIERVKKVLERDNESLKKLQDLPYLKVEQLVGGNEALEQNVTELENKLSNLKTIETPLEEKKQLMGRAQAESETYQTEQKEQLFAFIQEQSLISKSKN